MILKYWDIKYDLEWQLKYLLNNKLTKSPKSSKNKNESKNMGCYSVNKKSVKCQMSNLKA